MTLINHTRDGELLDSDKLSLPEELAFTTDSFHICLSIQDRSLFFHNLAVPPKKKKKKRNVAMMHALANEGHVTLHSLKLLSGKMKLLDHKLEKMKRSQN